jgi:hypothetical protein
MTRRHRLSVYVLVAVALFAPVLSTGALYMVTIVHTTRPLG